VVGVALPGGRSLYQVSERLELKASSKLRQVSSSSRKPYTLFVDLHDASTPSETGASSNANPDEPAAIESTTMAAVDNSTSMEVDTDGHAPQPEPLGEERRDPAHAATAKQDDAEGARVSRIRPYATALRGMYCPCAGFAYNSLAGDRNIFVSAISTDSKRVSERG
jgi:hypothetical protein